MKKIVWTYGLIAGAILSVMMVLTLPFMDRIGFGNAEIIGYTSIVAALLLVFFGVRSYRDNRAGRAVSFWRAFTVGVLINIVASACYAATWQVVYYKLAPDFVERYGEYVIEKERAGGATEAELQSRSAEMDRFAELYRNPIISVAITFMEPFAVGIIVALVSAGILRRRPDPAVLAKVATSVGSFV